MIKMQTYQTSLQEIECLKKRIQRLEEEIGIGFRVPIQIKKGGNNMQELVDAKAQEFEFLKRRVQHLEEELSRVKMKMTGKKWL